MVFISIHGPSSRSFLYQALLGLEQNIARGELWGSNEDPKKKIALQRVFQSINVQRVIGTRSVPGHYEANKWKPILIKFRRENKVLLNESHHCIIQKHSPQFQVPNSFSKFRKYVEKRVIEAPINNGGINFFNKQPPYDITHAQLPEQNVPIMETGCEDDAYAHLMNLHVADKSNIAL